MKCVVCKNGDTAPGSSTVTLDRGKTILVFKHVPSSICQNCGEGYVEKETTAKLIKSAEAAAQSGVQVNIREFRAA